MQALSGDEAAATLIFNGHRRYSAKRNRTNGARSLGILPPMSRLCPLLALPLMLSACVEISSGLVAANSLSRLWFDWPPAPAVVEAPQAPEAPLYCYRTIADEVCHSGPLPQAEESRLIGVVGQEPHAR